MARKLGRTVQELGETMTSEEYGLHRADYSIYPYDDRSRDVMVAYQLCMFANANSSKEKKFKIEQFMIHDKNRVEDPNSVEALMRRFNK